MKIDNLITHVATGEADNSFVGIKIYGNHIHFYYPESYHFDENNYERDDFLDLLKTISIAKSQSKVQTNVFDSRVNENDLAFLSYIWIIEDFINKGFSTNTEKELKANQRGKINWKKTLQQQPIISGSSIIYTKLFAEVRSPRETVISEAYRYCVKKSATVIGWIYGVSPESIEAAPNAEKMIRRYLDAIKSELDSTFDDEKHSRLIHMENVLIGLDEKSGDNSIVYGADSYHYIFERMINSIFGTEKAEDFYPKFMWRLYYSSDKDKGLPGPTIRPDTILRYGTNDDIYIIDSKYYRYGSFDLSRTKGLPESSSIVKQITYGSHVQAEHPNNSVYNAFIIPYDSKSPNGDLIQDEDKSLVYIGYVCSDQDQDKTYGRIHTFLIDLKYVVKTWNRFLHNKDQKKLVDWITVCH